MAKPINTLLHQLVSALNQPGCHDGTRLGAELGVSRTAVWKAVQKLQGYGIPIIAHAGKGYELQQPLILLDPDNIQSRLHTSEIRLDVFESIDSTNTYLKSHASQARLQVCLAEQQTQGRGRLQRQWHSPFAQNLYLSMRFLLLIDLSELSGLSLVVSLAIAQWLSRVTQVQGIGVKWPNDVLHAQQKLAGCLVEVEAESHGVCQIIIGIGININMLESHSSITQAWTSLQNITGRYYDRNVLAAELIQDMDETVTRFSQRGLSDFLPLWQQYDLLWQKSIQLIQTQQTISGVAMGINEQGHILLKMADGSVRAFSSGDTSVAKSV